MRSLVFILMFTFTAAYAAESQTVKISMDLRNAPLSKLFQEIEKSSEYSFIYDAADVNSVGNRDFVFKDMDIVQILERYLGDSRFVYTVRDRHVIVNQRETTQQQPERTRVTGRITDSEGKPIVGATILVKGTATGTSSDTSGAYSLSVSPGQTIAFSCIGRVTREVVYRGQQTVNMILEESAAKIEEVVITGIFTRAQGTFTGSAPTFKREDLQRVSNTNVLQAIRNLDPSFRFTDNLLDGSNPNAMPEIQLRGQTGFPDFKDEYQSNPNQPLFILDGFETTLAKVIDLDMNRVESVTLLKDAAAKAIYGSKAANGVVVIETVKPTKGTLRLSYNGSLNVQAPDFSSYDLTNAREKLSVEESAGMFTYFSDNGIQVSTDPNRQMELDRQYNAIWNEILRGVDTDWKAKPVRTGIGHRHTLRLEGGDDYFTYGVDMSYNNVAGVMKGSDRNTMSGGVTLSYRYKTLMFRNNLDLTYNKGKNSPYGAFSEYTRMNPYLSPVDENGNIRQTIGTEFGRETTNPLWNATLPIIDFTDYFQVTNNLYVEWSPLEGLKATGRLGFYRQQNRSDKYLPPSHTDFAGYTTDEDLRRKGKYTKGNGLSTQLSTDVNVQYSKAFGEKHMIFANAGWSLSESGSESTTMVAEGFSSDMVSNIGFARQYEKDGRPKASEATTRNVGLLMALNYSYDNRYLFDASGRMSGSSQFGANNRWGQFWSLGLGWNVHEEKFMENVNWLELLKIRGSVGFTGSENFNSYQSKATFEYILAKMYRGDMGLQLLALANPNLKWQRKYDRNIGVDLSMLNRRLNLTFDYYNATTDNLLTDITIASSTGFNSYRENLGKVENIGFEVSAKYRVWQNTEKRAFLNVFAAVSRNKNTIKTISNSLKSFNDEQTSGAAHNKPIVRYAEGQSLSAIWAVPSLGIDPATGLDVFVTPDGTFTSVWNSNYLAVCGDTEPKMNGNFGFNFDYNGLSINMTTRFDLGGQLYNQTLVDKVENANLSYNVDRRIFTSRWKEAGDEAMFKNIKDTRITQATGRFVEDNDNLILSSINVSYDLNRLAFIERTEISRLRVGFSTEEVMRFSSMKVERGTSYPFARSFSFTLQAAF